jgi:hypothetical protein
MHTHPPSPLSPVVCVRQTDAIWFAFRSGCWLAPRPSFAPGALAWHFSYQFWKVIGVQGSLFICC